MRLKISGIEVELLAHITTDHGTQVLQLLLAHELINYGHIFSGQTLVVLQKSSTSIAALSVPPEGFGDLLSCGCTSTDVYKV